jgi:hypothetical protein
MATLSPDTLNQLLTQARLFLNQPKSDNSFWSDPELTGYINDGIRQYFLIIAENGEGQFDAKISLDLVQNVETVALPTDCFEVRSLYRVRNGSNDILRYNNNISKGYSTQGGNSGDSYLPYYFFRGNDIVLRPIPGFAETGGLILEYTAFPETLITGLDTMTNKISPIFKELVVKYCVYQAKLKESSVMGGDTYRPVEAHLADLFRMFKETVGGRSKFPQFISPFNP